MIDALVAEPAKNSGNPPPPPEFLAKTAAVESNAGQT